jgi:hypothetical protein
MQASGPQKRHRQPNGRTGPHERSIKSTRPKRTIVRQGKERTLRADDGLEHVPQRQRGPTRGVRAAGSACAEHTSQPSTSKEVVDAALGFTTTSTDRFAVGCGTQDSLNSTHAHGRKGSHSMHARLQGATEQEAATYAASGEVIRQDTHSRAASL